MNTTPCATKTGADEGYNFRLPLAEYVRSQALPVDKLGHQPRLYALTQLVGQGMSYDDDVVYAAAWLHDLGVFIGHRPEDPEELSRWDNVSYAMKQAPAALLRVRVPYNKSCTSRGSDPHPPAASASGLVRGHHPARCGYSRTAGSDRHLTCSGEDRPGYAISNVHRCRSHFAQEPWQICPASFTWIPRRRWRGQGSLCSKLFFEELDTEAHGALC